MFTKIAMFLWGVVFGELCMPLLGHLGETVGYYYTLLYFSPDNVPVLGDGALNLSRKHGK
jgi:hypothetical protein